MKLTAICAFAALAGAHGAPPTEEEVRSWFGLWDEALATLDSGTVAGMYGEGGTLLPTLSDEVRTDPAGIADYFDKFLANEPRGEIVEGYVEAGEDWASDIGVYEFTFGTTGEVVRGRYSYFYQPQADGTWKILHHHSSMMPEASAAQPITEAEVKALFGLWNDALKTLEPATVAARYAKKGVLLPTQSDDVRTDSEGIEDYFVKFLANEPTGEIVESHVTIGHDWAQDVGVYEFTFGTDGSKVRGRYSFIYTYEDGEWMIAHHHSSVMPEGIMGMAQPITEEEVRALFDVWNDALKTLEPETVAALYSEKGNLLPTLSDKQRLNREEIADYFVKFLALEPVGEILSGDVLIGHNWAQDAGIYEFTMGDGSKTRGRYTFVYIYEDGKWQIAQHHSSMMPESSMAALTEGVTEQDVKDLFKLWNDALLTKDPDTVARRYTKDAVLLPTVSDKPRDTHELIEDYFVTFLAGEPSGEIIESFVHIGDDWVSDVGIYEFTMATDGSKVRGRYSYVYAMEDGEWKIQHHHSSKMPEGTPDVVVKSTNGGDAPTKGVTKQGVRDLFKLWNDALLTKDPDTVARRYTKDAVLLPTVSDKPRDTHELIEDYFVTFLAGEPSGEIIESFVNIGHDWVSDVGIYEFTMATDGSKVRGRYSYVYAMEDGEWKIAHHHSSKMPEGIPDVAEGVSVKSSAPAQGVALAAAGVAFAFAAAL